jgi:hypothetical protein
MKVLPRFYRKLIQPTESGSIAKGNGVNPVQIIKDMPYVFV